MYLQSKYTEWYYKITSFAKLRAASKKDAIKLLGYCEAHHIIPKSLGGNNTPENLAFLTAREHFICHRLLTKMTVGKNQQRMIKAAYMMCLSTRVQHRYKITAKLFEKLKIDQSLAHSILTKGKPKHTPESRATLSRKATGRISPNKGKKMPESQRLNLTKIHKGKTISVEQKAKIIESRKWYKHSEETKRKISESNKGRVSIITEETKQKISNTLKGRPSPMKGRSPWNKGLVGHSNVSDEARRKMSQSRTGLTRSDETKELMKLSQIIKHANRQFSRNPEVNMTNADIEIKSDMYGAYHLAGTTAVVLEGHGYLKKYISCIVAKKRCSSNKIPLITAHDLEELRLTLPVSEQGPKII